MQIDFSKSSDGLVPAIVQDDATNQILMLGWMNAEALAETEQRREVVFFSRSKKRLWKKGETSGNTLAVVDLKTDCDNDTILIRAVPHGPTCHTGSYSCFGEEKGLDVAGLKKLESVIEARFGPHAPKESYVASLVREGPARMAQKVGEEGVEVALAGVGDNKERLISESADLVFHLLVLLRSRELGLSDIIKELQRRAK